MSVGGDIRLARLDEAPVLAAIYGETVRTLGPQLYTPAQVAAWSDFASRTEQLQALLEAAETFVWEEGGALLGFCTITATGYVNLLYVSSQATRRGIGGRLLEHAMAHAAAAHGTQRFTTHASHFSRALFARHGFETESEEHVLYNGEVFHRFCMVRDWP